jgi:alkylation response protein AidB-like acyl-CoA dehydrogenase
MDLAQHSAEEGWVGRAREVAPLIAALAPRIESERALPPELLENLHAKQLFRMLLPRSLGGGEVEPATLVQVLETLAMADGSTAWCVGQASGCALSAAYLAPEVAR